MMKQSSLVRIGTRRSILLGAFAALAATAACSDSTAPAVQVVIAPRTLALEVGESKPVAVAVQNTSNLAVTFSSSNQAVATVSTDGLVRGAGPGTAWIVAASAADPARRDSAEVTVTQAAIANLILAPSTVSVERGASTKLTVTATDVRGATLTGRTVSFTSSNGTIATVGTDGTVTGLNVGSATITAIAEGKSATATVQVTQPAVASISLTPTAAGLQGGETVQITALVRDARGATLTDRTVSWASSNTNVATVSNTGLVTGVGNGIADITASVEGKTAVSRVTVTVDPCRTPSASLPFNGTVNGVITTSGCQQPNGAYSTVYSLVVPTAGSVRIDLRSTAFEPEVVIVDASGTRVVGDPNSTATGSSIFRTLAAGTYRVIASAVNTGGTGAFTLSARAAEGGCGAPEILPMGATTFGGLDSGDCILDDNSLADVYEFVVGTAGTVQILMSSQQFDPMLVLSDATTGALIVVDDNGGGGTAARVTQVLQPGRYRVLARAKAAGMAGDYTIITSFQ